MMRPEFLEFLVVKFGYLSLVPCSEEGLVGGGKTAPFFLFETASPEGIGHWNLVLDCFLGCVVLAINRPVVLGGISQLEMTGPLVHRLYLFKKSPKAIQTAFPCPNCPL